MGHRHIALHVGDQIVGDLVVTTHGVSFFSVHPDLRRCDGRVYRSVDEVTSEVAKTFQPLAA